MNLTNYFENGLTYSDYLKKIENQLHDLKKSDPNSEMIQYYTLNLKRLQRMEKTFHLSDDQKAELKNNSKDFKILVISEGWCGDAAQVMPVVNAMAEEMGIEQKIVFRDENPELINNYLTDGAQSIPIFIGVNSEGKEIFKFGPRPTKGMELLKKHKENPESYTKEEFHNELQQWYNSDKGNSIFLELNNLMKSNI